MGVGRWGINSSCGQRSSVVSLLRTVTDSAASSPLSSAASFTMRQTGHYVAGVSSLVCPGSFMLESWGPFLSAQSLMGDRKPC